MPGARIWTLPEANAALGQVRMLLGDARDAARRMRDAQENMQDLRIVYGDAVMAPGAATNEEFAQYLEAFRAAKAASEAALLRFSALGIEVKDLEQGLVDFRGEVGGREVYLCWKDGEDSVRFWHSLESGFRGRKPIPGIA